MNTNETNSNTQNAAAFRVMVVITHDDTDGDRCPMNIHIPGLFSAENKARRFNTDDARGHYGWVTSNRGKPTDCIECGACEEICPQQLPIRELLKEIGARFEG